MKTYLEKQIRVALGYLENIPEGFDPGEIGIEFQIPNNPEHGDLSSNIAMQLARPLQRAPRQIAENLKAVLDLDPKRIAGVEIAGPGFINFRFSNNYLADGVADILEQGSGFGRTGEGEEKTAIVEYVSANPTGPLTVGHGRNAVLGDTIANLLEWTGYDVTREYYFNDAGRQMRVLGESVRAWYEYFSQGESGPTKVLDDGTVVPEAFPDEGYRGEYIVEIASSLHKDRGDELVDGENEKPFKEAAEKAIFGDIESTLERMDVRMDTFFNERSLYESSAVWDVVEALKEKDLAYEKEGAVWFATGKLGKTKSDDEGEHEVDTVLVKSSGEPTYRLPDIAYHMDKLERGFDKIVDVFGADHIATYPDVIRGVEALGGDASKIDVVIYQFVTLVRGGEPVKMSTRKANFVTLDELMDEVTPDVTRFFFLMRSPNTHLEFDLDLAKEASEKNPVFYLQYAHARICSIIRKVEETGISLANKPDLSLLVHDSEVDLMKALLRLPEEIALACEVKGPHKVATYLREVAVAFNQFYRDCYILGEETQLATARLHLARATQYVLANGLAVLGINAPDKM
ncbi:MAG: arginine--tRNA ligase [Rubricoccaceae bacterium]|nr:arginine--tRNA ligase [Rubricoccaceae bacterium]